MISHLKLRLAASALTLAAVLQPHVCQAQAAPAPAAALPHISITQTGKGAPVVLIPGLATPRDVWAAVTPQLAAHHRVILVQVNGFAGDTPGANLQPGLLDGIVADLHGWLAANRIAKPAVIGHSMGGLVALMLAKAHPADAGKLMIVDSLPFFAVLMAPPGVDPTVAMVEPQAKMMRDRVAAGYGKPIDPATLDAQTKGLALKPDSLARMRGWAAAADPRVSAEAVYEDLTTDLRPALPSIATPITLVYPWNDAGPSKTMADPFYRRQYAGAPHVSYVGIGDSGHFVMLDQPAAFAAAVAAFVQ